jgi:hypothetical protein
MIKDGKTLTLFPKDEEREIVCGINTYISKPLLTITLGTININIGWDSDKEKKKQIIILIIDEI